MCGRIENQYILFIVLKAKLTMVISLHEFFHDDRILATWQGQVREYYINRIQYLTKVYTFINVFTLMFLFLKKNIEIHL